MGRERFQSSPYPELVLSKEDQRLLLSLSDTLVQQNFAKYRSFVELDNREVDLSRWKHVKSRNDIHVHVRRETPDEGYSNATPVMLSVGTFPGKLGDLMLGDEPDTGHHAHEGVLRTRRKRRRHPRADPRADGAGPVPVGRRQVDAA
jgi:hypothetical protein